MKKPIFSIIIYLFCTSTLQTIQAQFPTKSLSSKVRSLQIAPLQKKMDIPIIDLASSNQIEIRFDLLDTNDEELRYRVVHCNTDWNQSDLSELEYLDGFNNNPIQDYAFSFNTYTKYIHYALQLPNDDLQMKLSGNYRVEIYRDSNKEEILLHACFAIVDRKVKINGIIKDITDIDYRKQHQQLEINVDLSNYSLRNAQTESKLLVFQNRRIDNYANINTPLISTPKALSYRNNRSLIFEAGNTFRRFEITQFRYAGLGVQGNRFIEPLFHVALNPIEQRSQKGFLYDRDQHGQFLIHALNQNNVNTEADYALVHFSFPYDTPLEIGKLFIAGGFNHYTFDQTSKMTYNFETSSFESVQLLKQGSYNYMVFNETPTKNSYSTAKVEGNYYETPNEYLSLLYHRPFGERYDRLIGAAVISPP